MTPEERKQKHREDSKRWYHKNKEKRRAYYAANKERIMAYSRIRKASAAYKEKRKHSLSDINSRYRIYGIDKTEYDRIKTEQVGVCAVCGLTEEGKVLCVDHCHRSGKVRGLLCSGCNKALGLMRDDPNRMRRAATYLERYPTHREAPVEV